MVEVVSRAGIEDLHHIRASAERADWEAAANDLAHRRQVGTNAQDLLEAADGKPEGYNLVADEERPTLVGQASRCREVLGGPGEDSCSCHRLQDDCGHLVACLFHHSLELAHVVVVDHAHQLADPLGYGSPVRVLLPGGWHLLPHAVVATFRLDYLLPSGKSPGAAHGHHDGLG